MITSQQAYGFWKIVPQLIEISTGIIIGITDRETVKEVIMSKDMKVQIFQPGMRVDSWGDRGTFKAMRTGEVQKETVNTVVFGVDLVMLSIPFVDDADKAAGALCFGVLHYHPIAKAFPYFAPMIAEMFSEGGMLYLTDLEKVTNIQDSAKYSYKDLKVGDGIQQDVTASDALKNRRMAARELTHKESALPILSASYPLFDIEDQKRMMGTLNIIIPKQGAHELRNIASNLTQNLEEMAAVVQELAASASEVMTNEQNLNNQIIEVSGLINDINSILQFIRQIADETKMLGLNAAIEAARAGEAGRGFGVVASEIRKMSDESKDTVNRIRALTSKIETSIRETIKNSDLNMRTSEEQAAATQEITASIEEITAMSQVLERIAKEKL